MSNSNNSSPKECESEHDPNYRHHHHRHHEPHSKTLPHIDIQSIAISRPLATTLIPSNSFSERTHEVNLSLDVNDEELSLHSHLQSYYQASPANSIHSIHSIDRSSPSSLLLHQSVTSYPNLPSPLTLNDSKTPEENVLCALEPCPKRQRPYKKCLTKPKLLREAAKSEPPVCPSRKDNLNIYKKIQHIKSSKSLHHNNIANLHHITSQPPPMPSYYIHRGHKSRTPSNLSSISTLSNTSSNIYSPPLTHSKHQSMNLQNHLKKTNLFRSRHPIPLLHSNSLKSPNHKQQRTLTKPQNNHTHNHVHFNTNPNTARQPRHETSHSTIPKARKKTKKNRKKSLKRSETPQPVYSNPNKTPHDNVRVMRDKEVLQIDQEIPIEKFISALKKGYARIMTEDDQNEEYTKSARIARSVSVGNMQAYKIEILAEEEQRRKKRKKYKKHPKKKKRDQYRKYTKKTSKSTKNTPNHKRKRNGKHYPRSATERNSKFKFTKDLSKTIPPKLAQGIEHSTSGTDSDSSSMGDLVGPPSSMGDVENEIAHDLMLKPSIKKIKSKKLKRSQTHENRDHKNDLESTDTRGRTRSKTTESQNDVYDDDDDDDSMTGRNRANCYYSRKAPSEKCPRSPTIPEEDDDVLDIDPLLIGDEESHSDLCFSSDSESSSSSTDHGCEMVKPQKGKRTKTIKVNKLKTKETFTELPPTSTPALKSSAKSLNDVRTTLSPKFKIIKQTLESDEDEDDEDEDSMEELMTDELESEGSIGSIGSGNHLTTRMYTKIEQHNTSPLKLSIVDEMRQKSLSDHSQSAESPNIKEDRMKESSPPTTRGRSLSNESASSNSSSASSSSGSSDWDQEVREEEEEAVRQHKIANGILSEEESETESESDESEQSSELQTSSDSDDECDDTKLKEKVSITESLTESESEPECDDDKTSREQHNEHNYNARPQSTPFRSSKGTTVFLSHLKRFDGNDIRASGNLNDLINQTRARSTHIAMNTAHSSSSLIQNESKRKRKNVSQQDDSAQIRQITKEKHLNGYNNTNPMKNQMKNQMLKSKQMANANRNKYKSVQKRKNALNSNAIKVTV